jgi:hypothetical protein
VRRLYRLMFCKCTRASGGASTWPCTAIQRRLPTGQGQRWRMDFVHGRLVDGRPSRIRTVVDRWSREGPILDVAFRLRGGASWRSWNAFLPRMGMPGSITVDHGTEFMSKALGQRGVLSRRPARLYAARQAHGQRADRIV